MVGLGGGAVMAPLCPVPPIGSGSATVPRTVTITIDGQMIAKALVHQLDYGGVNARKKVIDTIAAAVDVAIRK
jgi:hypothetical protein